MKNSGAQEIYKTLGAITSCLKNQKYIIHVSFCSEVTAENNLKQ